MKFVFNSISQNSILTLLYVFGKKAESPETFQDLTKYLREYRDACKLTMGDGGGGIKMICGQEIENIEKRDTNPMYFVAPQCGALRISAYRDFQPNPIHPIHPIHL